MILHTLFKRQKQKDKFKRHERKTKLEENDLMTMYILDFSNLSLVTL